MKSLLFGTILLAVVLTGASFVAAAPGAPLTAAAATPAWPYTLYGSFSSGWGLTPSTISKPGPTLVVTTGDILQLKLFSQDSLGHNWTIDLNNNTAWDPGEPGSAGVSSPTVPTFYNLTITLAPGTYTYRCGIHPTSMWGMLVVYAKPTFTLWGSGGTPNGWGFTSDTISYPGPTLNVNRSQTVTVDLFSADGADHTFYVDFANSGSASGNTVSTTFNGSHSLRVTFVAGTAGNFTYACSIHGQTVMKGVVHVTAPPAPPPAAGPDYTLYAAAIVIIVIVAVIAAILIRRKPRTPPAQPPEQPPQG